MKIALVCDWLTGMRGGERCLEAVCELYPQAEIFTLVHFSGQVSGTIESHEIKTSYIQRLPGDLKKFRRYLPFFASAMKRLDLGGFDLVVSFSHCVAKGVKAPPGAPHICYCHTPMRYAWHMRDAYLRNFGPVKKAAANFLLDRLKRWDKKTSACVTEFIANSQNVKSRIKQAYDRDAAVIYPPVDCERFALSSADDGYFLVVSALVPYKRVDIAVEAFAGLKHKLLIVGTGPQLETLKSIAARRNAGNIRFIETAADEQVTEFMQKCTALLFCGEEDFGIVPLEAQSCGKPVIAYGKGGALETVIALENNSAADVTGLFFSEQTPGALAQAVETFEKNRQKFRPQACRQNALRFDKPVYKSNMKAFIDAVLARQNGD